jgi:hypothetical protein
LVFRGPWYDDHRPEGPADAQVRQCRQTHLLARTSDTAVSG